MGHFRPGQNLFPPNSARDRREPPTSPAFAGLQGPQGEIRQRGPPVGDGLQRPLPAAGSGRALLGALVLVPENRLLDAGPLEAGGQVGKWLATWVIT